ncbi:hypothetical protein T484DRAFT_2530618 [Baffinella frigidus]|nr:hypothetical protein T484DRAFT_2530618 [Cryptophyta sp. CCMP2293]
MRRRGCGSGSACQPAARRKASSTSRSRRLRPPCTTGGGATAQTPTAVAATVEAAGRMGEVGCTTWVVGTSSSPSATRTTMAWLWGRASSGGSCSVHSPTLPCWITCVVLGRFAAYLPHLTCYSLSRSTLHPEPTFDVMGGTQVAVRHKSWNPRILPKVDGAAPRGGWLLRLPPLRSSVALRRTVATCTGWLSSLAKPFWRNPHPPPANPASLALK